jgi:hypothetical protein
MPSRCRGEAENWSSFLYMTWCAVSVHKIMRPVFFEGTNSINSDAILQGINRQGCADNTLPSQDLKNNFLREIAKIL